MFLFYSELFEFSIWVLAIRKTFFYMFVNSIYLQVLTVKQLCLLAKTLKPFLQISHGCTYRKNS